MNIGDRVKFRTIGGWYNSGIIKDMDEESYLIEVDKSEDIQISLPYFVRVLSSCEIISEKFAAQIEEDSHYDESDMTNGEKLKTIFPSITEEFNNRPDEIIVLVWMLMKKYFS